MSPPDEAADLVNDVETLHAAYTGAGSLLALLDKLDAADNPINQQTDEDARGVRFDIKTQLIWRTCRQLGDTMEAIYPRAFVETDALGLFEGFSTCGTDDGQRLAYMHDVLKHGGFAGGTSEDDATAATLALSAGYQSFKALRHLYLSIVLQVLGGEVGVAYAVWKFKSKTSESLYGLRANDWQSVCDQLAVGIADLLADSPKDVDQPLVSWSSTNSRFAELVDRLYRAKLIAHPLGWTHAALLLAPIFGLDSWDTTDKVRSARQSSGSGKAEDQLLYKLATTGQDEKSGGS